MAALVKDLIDRVQRLVDRVDATYRVRALDAIDEAVQWYANRLPFDGMERSENFTADGTRFLVLPDRVSRPIDVLDVTNARKLRAGDHFESRDVAAYAQETAGAAYEWRPSGTVPVITQPSTDVTLSFTTTASDGMAVRVEGLVFDSSASGTALELQEESETITMNGATKTSSNVYRQITSIQKDKASISDLRVSYDGALKSRVPSWATTPLYQRIEFLYVPLAGTQFKIKYYERPRRLTSESDALPPFIDQEAVMWRAAGNLHWMDNEGQPADRAWRKAEEAANIIRNRETTFGERSYSIQPWIGYVNLEDDCI